MPVILLTDRRAAGNRLVRFVFQRHLETVLYGRSEGSSGPIWKAMNAAGILTPSMGFGFRVSELPQGVGFGFRTSHKGWVLGFGFWGPPEAKFWSLN